MTKTFSLLSMPSSRRGRGFSLIEVMIALLITSVGLLGLAALQVSAMKYNHNAYLRSQATFLAKDMAERMRANRSAALGGDYNIAFGAAAASSGSLADADLSAWVGNVGNALPGGQGAVAVNGRVANVSLRWEDARGETGPENTPAGELLTFNYTTEL